MVLPGVVRGFARLFGDKPRVHLLEALLRLAPVTFTRAELAEEAGLQKSSTNRIVQELERDGFIHPVLGTSPMEFEVAVESPDVQILNALEAALDLVDQHGWDGAIAQDAAEGFRRQVLETVLVAHEVLPTKANTETVAAKESSGGLLIPRGRRIEVRQDTMVTA